MRRLKVLLLPLPEMFEPWCADVVDAIGDRHDLRILDPDAPLAPQFAGVEAVLDHGGSVGTRAMMDVAVDAELWQIIGTGFDHFDLAYVMARGIPVANCPGRFSAAALAEAAMMFALMLARRYRETAERFQTGQLYGPMGEELAGKTLGIVGFGASGRALTRQARPFGMHILALDVRAVDPEEIDALQAEFVCGTERLDEVAQRSDFLSLHLHLNEETRHLIDERRLGLMKSTAHLINVARGALVDEDALDAALLAGRIGGAGLDVFGREPADPGNPVYELPNVVVTPHTSGVTAQTSQRRAACTAENVDRLARGEPLQYRIDT